MFKQGIHLLADDVWDCSNYQFPLEIKYPLSVTKSFSNKLIRIPNNSYLSERIMKRIALNIKKILNRSN